jgi:formate hydrogenlyase subunit 3/multisubunit Na+/H+ antiporter MnhD subunit
MSGVMITMGFYGLARFLPLLGPATAGTAGVLIALGAAGALGAIAHALVQRDVKRILAYSTVENAGLVTLAFGVARLGEASGHRELAALAWTAALLHLWNHALFKSLLFLGIGAAAQAAHSRDLERWGGLLRRWPLAGTLLLAGAASIAALPPFNGFVSEWLLLRALFDGALALGGFARAAMVLGIALLALTAALALAGIARLVGIGLLGAPRSDAFEHAPPPGWEMTVPMGALAGLCLAAGCLPGVFVRALASPVSGLVPGGAGDLAGSLVGPLGRIGAITVAVVLGLLLFRRVLARGRTARRAVTWDCGYALPDARMQYTASSLSEPIAREVALLLRTRVRWTGIEGLWPRSASWGSTTLDRAVTGVYRPALSRVSGFMTKLRNLQEPRVTTYLRYVVLALLVSLALLFLPVGMRP